MTTHHKLAFLALAAFVFTTSLAAAAAPIRLPVANHNGGDGGQANDPSLAAAIALQVAPPCVDIAAICPAKQKTTHPQIAVDCEVRAPIPTTDDLVIINVGNAVLASGTRIKFRVSSSDDQGVFLLPGTVNPGAKIKVRGILHEAETGSPCAVAIAL